MKINRLFLFGALLIFSVFMSACSDKDSSSSADNKKATDERDIVVLGDTINSHLQADAVCVVDSRFERGHTIVFRGNVLDEKTGKIVEDAKVKVVLGNGEEYDMKLGEHGAEATLLYTVSWTIPDDFPTGTLDYKIIANVDGKDYSYEPFNVSLSKLTILEKGEEAKLAQAANANTEKKE